MTCKDVIEQLYEFLDNELDQGSYLKTKQHFDMCHVCCEKFEFEQALKKTIKDRLPVDKTPQYVIQNIVNQWSALNNDSSHAELVIDESKGRYLKGIFDFFTLRPAYVTMTILLPMTIIGLAAYLSFFRPGELLPVVKVAAERDDSFVNNNINLGLISSDNKEIRSHYGNLQRSNLTIDIPERNEQEMEFLGCKNSVSGGKQSGYVGFTGDQNKILFEIVNESGLNIDKMEQEIYNGRSYYFSKFKGYNVVMWRHGNTLYSLTSTMNRRDLMRVASESIRSYNQ